MTVRVARVYDEPRPPGAAFLVERLWPRGVRKDALPVEGWLRDAAPSAELRRWYGHRVERFAEFRWRYLAELDEAPQAWRRLVDAARSGDVVLLYSARDREHNSAVVLRERVERALAEG